MREVLTRRVSLLLCALLISTVLLVGCAGGTGASGAANGEKSSDSVLKKDSIVIELNGSPNLLDPPTSGTVVEWTINANLYDNLFKAVRQDFDNCVPWMVESYEIENDNKDWTLTLREGIKFHNGDALTVEDVIDSLEHQRVGAISSWGLMSVNSIEKLDERTLVIKQEYPSPILIETLAGPQFGIRSKKLLEEYGVGAREGMIGTGPYQLTDWTADNNVTLDYFEDYFMANNPDYGVPDIKQVTFRPMLDANAATIAFESGEINVFSHNVMMSAYERFREDPNVRVVEVTRTSVRGLSMNNSHEKFTDIRVRRAMNHAMDKEKINTVAAYGQGNTDVLTHTDARASGYSLALEEGLLVKYEYDPEKALALLAEAGYDKSNPLKFEIMPSMSQGLVDLGSAMQDMLANVDVEAEVNPVELAQYMQRLSTGTFEASAAQWGFEYYWAPMMYIVHIHSGYYFNYEQTHLDRVDELADQGVATWDPAEREKMYAELLHILTDEAVVVPVYQLLSIVCSSKGLAVYPDTTNVISPVYWMEWVDD